MVFLGALVALVAGMVWAASTTMANMTGEEANPGHPCYNPPPTPPRTFKFGCGCFLGGGVFLYKLFFFVAGDRSRTAAAACSL